ncbi:MAG: InlB B-repeat-containing protein [Paludibacteraceae bacterium]|nr:InlB B-repeat-containing protein [Paludibacteraceae bacterium]
MKKFFLFIVAALFTISVKAQITQIVSWQNRSLIEYGNGQAYDLTLRHYPIEFTVRGTGFVHAYMQVSYDCGKSWSLAEGANSFEVQDTKTIIEGESSIMLLLQTIELNRTGVDSVWYRTVAVDMNTNQEMVSDTLKLRAEYPLTTSWWTEGYWSMPVGQEWKMDKAEYCMEYQITSEFPLVDLHEDYNYVYFKMPACPVDIKKVEKKYTVTYYNADYKWLDRIEVECGTDATHMGPTTPEYGTYKFIGWNKDLSNVQSNMSVVARYDIGNDYDLFVTLDEHRNDRFAFDGFVGNETRAMVGDELTFSVGIFATANASIYYETAQWNNTEQEWVWPSQQDGGKKVGDYTANTQGLLSQKVTVCYDVNTQYVHAFEHRLAVRFYLVIAGQRVYSEPYEFDVYYPLFMRSKETLYVTNNVGNHSLDDEYLRIPARCYDTIHIQGINGASGDCFTYQRVLKPSSPVDNGVDNEDKAYIIAPGELDTILVNIPTTPVVFEVTGQGKEEYKKYGNNVYYAEEVACGGSVAHMPEDPEEAGSIFLGWESWSSSDYPDDAYTHVPAGFPMVGFSAKWEELPEVPKYTVKFFGKDSVAQIGEDQLVNEGEDAVPPTAPEVSGFHFVGWDKPYTTITANTEIVALYGEDAKTWTVTYQNWDGTALDTEEVNDGEAAKGVIATRDNYTFAGWVNPTTDEAVDLSHVTADITVKAAFTLNVYTITYTHRPDGEVVEEIATEEVKHGEMPTYWTLIETMLEEDIKQGMGDQYVANIKGWNPTIVAATEDASYELLYTISLRKYTVRFQNWDFSLLDEQQVEYGKAATAPADPTREGFTFKGWDRAFDNIIADKVVTALFEKNKEDQQGIDETVNRQSSNRKFVEDGSLFIALPDGRIYNANGLRVK